MAKISGRSSCMCVYFMHSYITSLCSILHGMQYGMITVSILCGIVVTLSLLRRYSCEVIAIGSQLVQS